MQKEWKMATIGIVAVVIFMVTAWSLSNVPHAWLELAGFILLFFVTGGPIAYGIITIRHHHHKVTEHHISQFGTVLSQHGKLYKLDPVHPTTHSDREMQVYHHKAYVEPPSPLDVEPEVQVTEERTPQKMLSELSSDQQGMILEHVTKILTQKTGDSEEEIMSRLTPPRNVISIDPIEQRSRELYKQGNGRTVIARELDISEDKARRFVEKFTREGVEREVV